MIEINEELLKEEYKEIQKECLVNGVLVPSLLLNYLDSIPVENRLTLNEVSNIRSNLSDDVKEQFKENSRNRDKLEYEIYNETSGLKKRKELINVLEEDEFIEWLKKFPQYNNLIK